MIRVGEMFFREEDKKIAKKVAKLNNMEFIESIPQVDIGNMFVKVSRYAVCSSSQDKDVVIASTLLNISAVDLPCQPLDNIVVSEGIPYSQWIEDGLWTRKKPVQVKYTKYYNLATFTKKQATLDFKNIDNLFKEWVERSIKEQKYATLAIKDGVVLNV